MSRSPLKGMAVLVTGGPTPVPLDAVRRITNRFRGKLGVRITEELYLRGADVCLIHGDGAFRPPKHLPWRLARTYDEYRDAVLGELGGEAVPVRDLLGGGGRLPAAACAAGQDPERRRPEEPGAGAHREGDRPGAASAFRAST